MRTRVTPLSAALAWVIGCASPPPTKVESTAHSNAAHEPKGSPAHNYREAEAPTAEANRQASSKTGTASFVPIIREEQTVVVDGKSETWRLVWKSPPQPICDNLEFTCPCIGFQYGETAQLDLVRVRSELPDDRLPLTPFFAGAENPAMESGVDGAVLQRWPVLESDVDKYVFGPPSNTEITSRPLVRIMNIGDFDHDGRATEFVLQIGTEPCGHSDTILVGISKSQPRLHAFTTGETPGKPLVTERPAWDALRNSSGIAHYTVITCGDHGSETEIDLILTANRNGLHASEQAYECDANFHRGRKIHAPQ
ncbi:MAG TPA: hypothetical protein VL137_05965 [Polyangiaceae bacterium]|nr:hypothetical protein [Polyangiaceae bacterium]